MKNIRTNVITLAVFVIALCISPLFAHANGLGLGGATTATTTVGEVIIYIY